MIYAVTHSGTACLDDYSLREISSDCEPNLSVIPNPAVRPPWRKAKQEFNFLEQSLRRWRARGLVHKRPARNAFCGGPCWNEDF